MYVDILNQSNILWRMSPTIIDLTLERGPALTWDEKEISHTYLLCLPDAWLWITETSFTKIPRHDAVQNVPEIFPPKIWEYSAVGNEVQESALVLFPLFVIRERSSSQLKFGMYRFKIF
jgi:hypothetical protein